MFVTFSSQAEQLVIQKLLCSLTGLLLSLARQLVFRLLIQGRNIINNGRFVGDRMKLNSSDVVCCPPPLFHCFGLVLGLIAVVTHGSSIVFPSETFNADATIRAVVSERCTALHGVPAMFSAQLELLRPDYNLSRLRTGIAAGAPIPRNMMIELRERMNLYEITNTYGKIYLHFSDSPMQKQQMT